MAEAPHGAAAFEQSCGSCHTVARWQGANAIGTSPQSRAELEALLSRRHTADPSASGAIIDYLSAQRC